MASGESSNKALVPIIAIGAALVLGVGVYFMMGGEEPVETPTISEPQQVSEPAPTAPAPAAPTASRTRDSEESSDRAARSRGPEPTEQADAKPDRQRRAATPKKAKKDDTPKAPASSFWE